MFQLIGLGEQAGSGFPKIYKKWKEQDWKTPELIEDFGVFLSNAATTATAATATIATSTASTSIVDDDNTIDFSIATVSATVTEDATDGDSNAATFTLSYTGTLASGETASIDVAHTLTDTVAADYTNDLTAALTSAVTGATGVTLSGSTVTFSGGAGNDTSIDFTLSIDDDTLDESDEVFSIDLSGATTTASVAAGITTSSVTSGRNMMHPSTAISASRLQGGCLPSTDSAPPSNEPFPRFRFWPLSNRRSPAIPTTSLQEP